MRIKNILKKLSQGFCKSADKGAVNDIISSLNEKLFKEEIENLNNAKFYIFPWYDRCFTIGNNIFLRSSFFSLDRFFKKQFFLIHEAVHLGQFKKYGTFGFILRYLFPGNRFVLEQEAYKKCIINYINFFREDHKELIFPCIFTDSIYRELKKINPEYREEEYSDLINIIMKEIKVSTS